MVICVPVRHTIWFHFTFNLHEIIKTIVNHAAKKMKSYILYYMVWTTAMLFNRLPMGCMWLMDQFRPCGNRFCTFGVCIACFTCTSLMPHLYITHASLVHHSCLMFTSLKPHLHITHASLAHHSHLTCASFDFHLCITHTSLTPHLHHLCFLVKPLALWKKISGPRVKKGWTALNYSIGPRCCWHCILVMWWIWYTLSSSFAQNLSIVFLFLCSMCAPMYCCIVFVFLYFLCTLLHRR